MAIQRSTHYRHHPRNVSAAQFLYDRSQQPSLSSYMAEKEIPEEDEDQEDDAESGVGCSHDSFHLNQLGLSPVDEGEHRKQFCSDNSRV